MELLLRVESECNKLGLYYHTKVMAFNTRASIVLKPLMVRRYDSKKTTNTLVLVSTRVD